MAYEFYLNSVRLPVTPAKLQLSIQNQNTTVSLINDREISFLKSPGLTSVTFEMEVPHVKRPYAVYPDGFKTPDYYTGLLKTLKLGKMPFQFKVIRALPDGKLAFNTDLKVSLEEYKLTEDVKQGTDLIIDVKLKEYHDYGTKTLQVSQSGDSNLATATVQQPRSASAVQAVHTALAPYTVEAEDTLWNIAKKHYGNGSRYIEIAKANHLENPERIAAGQTLILP